MVAACLYLRAGREGEPAASFLAGLVVCGIALESPVDALGSARFSGHMLQIFLLSVVALLAGP